MHRTQRGCTVANPCARWVDRKSNAAAATKAQRGVANGGIPVVRTPRAGTTATAPKSFNAGAPRRTERGSLLEIDDDVVIPYVWVALQSTKLGGLIVRQLDGVMTCGFLHAKDRCKYCRVGWVALPDPTLGLHIKAAQLRMTHRSFNQGGMYINYLRT